SRLREDEIGELDNALRMPAGEFESRLREQGPRERIGVRRELALMRAPELLDDQLRRIARLQRMKAADLPALSIHQPDSEGRPPGAPARLRVGDLSILGEADLSIRHAPQRDPLGRQVQSRTTAPPDASLQ